MSSDPRLGTVLLGKYAIESVLGEGGMGVVYAARHLRIDRPVAIKFLHAPYAGDRRALGRFFDEARAAGGLRHPNVVDVYDVDEDGGAPFMVQELLSGESLGALLEARGRLPPREAWEIVDPLLDALAVAHDRGIVHRDLKPDNIFLAREAGRLVPKLLDFGIAKLMDGGSATATATGTAVGTPLYMAPEQARGQRGELGPWTDVWSMGVVLFESLSGRLHFDVSPELGAFALLARVASERPRSLAEVAPELPLALVRAVDAALEPDPRARTRGARALRAALRAALGEPVSDDPEGLALAETLPATPATSVPATAPFVPPTRVEPARSSRALAIAGGVLGVLGVLGLGAGLVAFALAGAPERPEQSAPEPSASPLELEPAPRIEGSPAGDDPAEARLAVENPPGSEDAAALDETETALEPAAPGRAREGRATRREPPGAAARTRTGEWRVDEL